MLYFRKNISANCEPQTHKTILSQFKSGALVGKGIINSTTGMSLMRFIHQFIGLQVHSPLFPQAGQGNGKGRIPAKDRTRFIFP